MAVGLEHLGQGRMDWKVDQQVEQKMESIPYYMKARTAQMEWEREEEKKRQWKALKPKDQEPS